MNIKSCVYLISMQIVAGVLAIATSGAWAGDIVLKLEEPTLGSVYSGVANIRGWVVGSARINRVELYIDGQYENNIPVGGKRTDVGNAYPSYPDSADSGFSMAFNYSNKVAGTHNIRVRAVDEEGDSREITRAFVVVRFDNPYTKNGVSLNDANVTDVNGKTIIIRGMIVDGKVYDARLDWQTEIQGYAFSEITKANNGDDIVFPYFNSPRSGVAGSQIYIELSVQNNGSQSATFRVSFYLSKNYYIITPNESLHVGCDFSLPPKASDVCAGLIGIPAQVAAGSYFLIGYIADNYPAAINPITITSGGCRDDGYCEAQ